MLAEPRRRQLLDLIARRGFANLEELVKAIGVSESTVRRDLEALDLAGSIRRTHGGAVYTGETKVIASLDERAATAHEEKVAIGRAAAELLDDGDTVLLDGGTTTLEVARALMGRPVQVVTNSLPIANLLASSVENDLVLIGGYVLPRTGVATGPLAVAAMQDIRVHKTIMGAGGIVAEGVFNANSLLVETERQMMKCAQEVLLVADHSKFGRLSLSKLCRLDEIGMMIVDSGLSDEYQAILSEADVAVRVVDVDRPAHQHQNGSPRGGGLGNGA
jgi:DeoR/GlpR family transcriptional regulator of sugar metabolism